MDAFLDLFGCAERRQTVCLATVAEVYADGLSLTFDGESQATQKHYKCNTAISFAAGDRVKLCLIGGTYVVEYVVGDPLIT